MGLDLKLNHTADWRLKMTSLENIDLTWLENIDKIGEPTAAHNWQMGSEYQD